MNNIKQVVEQSLCIECGICKSICPQNCIKIIQKKYNYNPQISDECINCGLCLKTCPITNITDYDKTKSIEKNLIGKYKNILSAKTKNNQILENATSGGVATQIINELLKKNKYDCAFLVDGYSYEHQLETKYFDRNSNLTSSQKSRYLTISHTKSCEYIAQNPNKKVILIGTGCVISGFLNFIKLKKLNRDNYLLLGLFCDKTMNYGVVEYFKQHPMSQNKKIKNLYFRTKKAGGWPGNVRIEYTDNSIIDLPNTARMEVKDYFILERCLYCLDKLNKNADISIGDNYISAYKDIEGISSVIIRTNIGQKIFSELIENFEIKQNSEEELIKSQHLKEKAKNLAYSKIKGLIKGFTLKKNKESYSKQIEKMELAKSTFLYTNIQNNISKEKEHKIINILGIKIKIRRKKKCK